VERNVENMSLQTTATIRREQANAVADWLFKPVLPWVTIPASSAVALTVRTIPVQLPEDIQPLGYLPPSTALPWIT